MKACSTHTSLGLVFSWEHSSCCDRLVSWCFLSAEPQAHCSPDSKSAFSFTDEDLEVKSTLNLGSLQELLRRALVSPVLGQHSYPSRPQEREGI